MNVTGLDELKKLASELKQFKQKVNEEGKWAVNNLHKEITLKYERNIFDLVYDRYDPVKYERTYHLLGGHGAKDEAIIRAGKIKKYEFSIDENSRDPVDGTTWGEKADAIEHGSTQMFFAPGQTPFNRPFIKETQKDLEFELKKTADEFVRYVDALLKKMEG